MSRLSKMTTVEAETAMAAAKLAILPIGSLEQHGPHLPLDTDAAIADALARRVDETLGEQSVLCPLVAYGLSEHHLGFSGTITLRPETLTSMLSDIFESLQHQGISRVLIVNGHGGNIDVIRTAGREARRDRGMLVASAMWAIVASDTVRAHADSDIFGHACETETSVMMALMPERVLTDQIPTKTSFASIDPLTDPPGGRIDEAVWLDQWSSTGAIGDPSSATAEAGQAIVSAFLDRTVAYATRMIERPLPGENT